MIVASATLIVRLRARVPTFPSGGCAAGKNAPFFPLPEEVPSQKKGCPGKDSLFVFRLNLLFKE
jgi:hypothetical protein